MMPRCGYKFGHGYGDRGYEYAFLEIVDMDMDTVVLIFCLKLISINESTVAYIPFKTFYVEK